MDKIMIDGSTVLSREDFFETVRRQVGDSRLIGSNLDALHDALTSLTTHTVLEIQGESQLAETLGDYWKRILWCINDCLDENENLKLSTAP